jgi:NTP pyrophosphatase (non-canonical NTP hydrolase)
MKLTNEFEPIRDWARERGIYEKGDSKTQFIKLQEEVGELAKALLKNDEAEIIDAIGDCVVVLTNLAELCPIYTDSCGLDIERANIEYCVNKAYKVIMNRTGKMENGTFVKSQEIQNKKNHKLRIHKNGYYNLPCKFSEINMFLSNNTIEIEGVIYDNNSDLHIKAKPSRNGGNAYVYKRDLK